MGRIREFSSSSESPGVLRVVEEKTRLTGELTEDWASMEADRKTPSRMSSLTSNHQPSSSRANQLRPLLSSTRNASPSSNCPRGKPSNPTSSSSGQSQPLPLHQQTSSLFPSSLPQPTLPPLSSSFDVRPNEPLPAHSSSPSPTESTELLTYLLSKGFQTSLSRLDTISRPSSSSIVARSSRRLKIKGGWEIGERWFGGPRSDLLCILMRVVLWGLCRLSSMVEGRSRVEMIVVEYEVEVEKELAVSMLGGEFLSPRFSISRGILSNLCRVERESMI